MSRSSDQATAFGTIFVLANKLQILGDRLDPRLTVKQWLLLAGIASTADGQPTLSTLATRIGSSRQNVKKMAIILEREGFVSLSKDPQDARALLDKWPK